MNLRASRSVPFVSKAFGHNFIQLAVDAMLGRVPPKKWRKQNFQTLDANHVCVKAPQFSFSRLRGADPQLGVEMASTGEVACFGRALDEALLKAYLAVGFRVPRRAALLSAGKIQDKVALLPIARRLAQLGLRIWATPGTAAFLKKEGLPARRLAAKPGSTAAAQQILKKNSVDLLVNFPANYRPAHETAGYFLRRAAADLSVPLLINPQLARGLVEALARQNGRPLELASWEEYL